MTLIVSHIVHWVLCHTVAMALHAVGWVWRVFDPDG